MGETGVQADVNTMSALGCHAMTAVTSITAQTTLGIQEFYDVPAHIVAGQIEAVMNDVQQERNKRSSNRFWLNSFLFLVIIVFLFHVDEVPFRVVELILQHG
ncbi:MAG: bifunctional hydroxymethylpyrimidine kinase/phosphomethylpyrimidine kinase [Prevotella sp.]|nr:bifunctional hydroxymethylpyrimidine kinase/phosphomethylpyrimidine kinase [Prevotella sp.]